jgi:OPA family glycerol-3-phosphate transporter-like MFS transporter
MNNTKKSTRILFALLFVAYAAIYIGRKNFSVCMAGMVADGVIDKLIGGYAGTAFLAVYACGQLVNGLLGDRISPVIMISAGLFGSGVSNAAMGLVVHAASVPVIWGICGFFCSMLWAPVVRCISEWIPESERSLAGVNISVTLPVGSMASYIICAVMIRYFGWREAFFACAVILFSACAIFLFGFSTIREYIREMNETGRLRGNAVKERNKETAKTSSHYSFPHIFILTGLIWVAGGILFNGVLKDGLDLWVPTCITEYFGMSVPVSSLLTGILPIVNLAGVYMASRINDRFFRNEMVTAAVMFGVSMVSFIPLLAITVLSRSGAGIYTAVIAVLLISVTSSSMLGANTMLITFIPFRFSAVGHSSGVSGLLNSFSYAAASLSGVTIGLISTNFGWTATIVSFAVCSACGTAVCAAGAHGWKRGSQWLSGEGNL